MDAQKKPIDVMVAPVILADYSIVCQKVETRAENEEPAPRKSDIKIELVDSVWLEPKDDDRAQRISAQIRVEVDPSEGSNFYACSIEIAGLFLVAEPGQDEASIEAYVATRGAQELYDIARVQLSQATANGTFGSLMLPSIVVNVPEGANDE